ncbi:MAG: DUF4198 domain-containing protein [Paracoccaceae bacterium]|nr:DUF4198 domain-containing protein [Paracoccaceae bacterium]MDG2259129.1 DUF4198 domain-containing protein [Paracoccaceae bacterium]
MILKSLPFIFVFACTTPVLAHELWIEPEAFEAQSGGAVNAALVNGQDFEGRSLAYATRSIERLEYLSGGTFHDIEGLLGSRPAIQLNDVRDGLLILGYVSKAARLNYKTWDKFAAFAEKKGLENALSTHTAMGIDPQEFDEGYTRFSKSLVGVGSALGSDQTFDFEAEFVALDNPYSNDLTEISLTLNYQTEPRSNALVEVFERDGMGSISKFNATTNDEGIVTIPVKPGHAYMLDTVVFRAPSAKLLDRMEVDWETLWANITFAIPNN